MTEPSPNGASAIAAQTEDAATMLFEVAFASMVLNGMSRNYKMTIVLEHGEGEQASTIVVGTLPYERSRDVLTHYIDKQAAAKDVVALALTKMKESPHG